MQGTAMTFKFSAEIWTWRGPSPYFFVTVPPKQCSRLAVVSTLVTYGWGMIPVTARIGGTRWTTSLFPKEGRYLVPLKDSVRKTEGIGEGDRVTLHLEVQVTS